jgi:hypothetical protein
MSLSEQILGSFYKPEAIHTKSVEKIGKGTIKVRYNFSPYERTINDMGHVGMSQMNEALVEGLYCAIGYAIEDGDIQTTLDIGSYIRRMTDALFVRENLSFRTLLKPGENAELTIEIVGVREEMRGRYYGVTAKVTDGFIRGEAECWLNKNEEQSPAV